MSGFINCRQVWTIFMFSVRILQQIGSCGSGADKVISAGACEVGVAVVVTAHSPQHLLYDDCHNMMTTMSRGPANID